MAERGRDRRHVSRKPSRFSTTAHVSKLSKENRELVTENRQLRSDKKEVDYTKRRLEASNRRLAGEVEELSADLRVSKQAQRNAEDRIDDLAAIERKLARQNLIQQEELERVHQTRAELQRSKKGALQDVLKAILQHVDPDEHPARPEGADGSSTLSDGKRVAGLDSPRAQAKRARPSPVEAAEDDDDSSSTSGEGGDARRDETREGVTAGPQARAQPPAVPELLVPDRGPASPGRAGDNCANQPSVSSPLSPTIQRATPGAL